MASNWRLALVAVALTSVAMSSARAETITLKTELKAANEVPPNNSPATGRAEATLDTASRHLSWRATYSGLSGPATGVHFHGPAEPGKNAGIVVPLPGAASPLAGSATITQAQAADLLAGRWYINVHTAQNPGGEIRGQMSR